MVLFEVLMLVCFGVAWPFSIYRSFTSRSTVGKSIVFLWVVWVGYIFGIVNKVIQGVDYALIFYVINLAMVSVDTVLYYRNLALSKSGK